MSIPESCSSARRIIMIRILVEDHQANKSRIRKPAVQCDRFDQHVAAPVDEVLLEVVAPSIPEINALDLEGGDEAGLFCSPRDVDLLVAYSARHSPLRTGSTRYTRRRRQRLHEVPGASIAE